MRRGSWLSAAEASALPLCIMRLATGTELGNTWISSMTMGCASVRTALITLPLSERNAKRLSSFNDQSLNRSGSTHPCR